MLSREAFVGRFEERFDGAGEEEFGEARMTTLELATLRRMRREEGSRQGVVERVVREGWLQPRAEEITGEAVAEAAIAHGCVVGKYLARTRGLTRAAGSYFSYTTKDQADRWLARVFLGREGGRREELRREWETSGGREEGYANAEVEYPPAVEETKIHGIAKPHRYWPAQLLRYLEAIRLGRISSEERERLKVGAELRAYAVEWRKLEERVKEAGNVDEAAVGVAVGVMEELRRNGLADGQVVEVVVAGYGPGGPVREHGKVPEVGRLWRGIIEAVGRSESVRHLQERMRQRVKVEMEKVGYPFS